MKFIFEDKNNLLNFTKCEDINTSGIRRFGLSPLLNASHLLFVSNQLGNPHTFCETNEDVENYIITAGVNHSPEDWTGYNPKVKSVFSHLNEKYLRDLRNGKAVLLLDQSFEGYHTPWLFEWFHGECNEWNINPKYVVYVTGNMIVDDVYDNWCIENNITEKMKVIGYSHFEYDMGTTAYHKSSTNEHLPTFNENLQYKIDHLDGIKTYTCLNKRIREHRVWFYYYLYHSGLLDKGLVSMNKFDTHWYNWEGRFFENIEELEEINNTLPRMVYNKPNNELDDNFYINRFPEQVVKDTFFTIVSEAHCGDSNQTMFLSEKTFKVIACRHPFMIMGNKDSMKMMRKIGYKTFDGFIDEGYDSLPTHERLNYIIESIRKIDEMKDKIEWYKSTKEIVEYNYNKLIYKILQVPVEFIELENYTNKLFNEKK